MESAYGKCRDIHWRCCKATPHNPDGPSITAFTHDCVFPFMYDGVEYHTCTTAGSSNGQPWCPTWTNPLGLGYGCNALSYCTWGNCVCSA